MSGIDYDDIQILKALDWRNVEGAPDDTCLDYVDAVEFHASETPERAWSVTIFVEPTGNETKYGPTARACLDWWYAVFASQPNVGYVTAGWHLLSWEGDFPGDPKAVWANLVIDVEPAKPLRVRNDDEYDEGEARRALRSLPMRSADAMSGKHE